METIVINWQFIGVVGITGDPEEVRSFCKLVKTTVSLLIEQSILIGRREAARAREAAFLDALLNEKKEYSQELINEAKYFQINLHIQTTVIILKNLKDSSLLEGHPFFKKQNEDVYILMLQNPNESEKIVEKLLQLKQKCVMAAGMHMLNVAESYHQAMLCLKISENLQPVERFIFYGEYQFLAELSQIQIQHNELHLPDLLLQTLRTYINHNGNPTTNSQVLVIHRTTLYYRLERIRQLTGKNPNHFIDLFELVYLLLQK